MILNEGAFNFIDVLQILLKKRKPIIIGTLIAAVITLAIGFIIPKSYKASASMIISESKTGSDGVLSNYFNPRYYYTFEGVVKNKDIAKKVIEKFGLDKEPYEMSVDDFIENIKVSLLRNSKLIELDVFFNDASKAAEIANYLAKEAVELNNSMNITDVEESRNTINEQLESARKNLEVSEKKLADYKAFARVKELETEIEILLYKLADLEIRNLDLSLKSEDAKTKSKELRNIDEKTSDTKTALIEKQKLLAERETQLETLTLKYETDQQLYKKIKSKFEESILKISEKSQEIRIVDHAYAPAYPEYPKKKLMTMIASVLAFIALCLFYLIKERLSE